MLPEPDRGPNSVISDSQFNLSIRGKYTSFSSRWYRCASGLVQIANSLIDAAFWANDRQPGTRLLGNYSSVTDGLPPNELPTIHQELIDGEPIPASESADYHKRNLRGDGEAGSDAASAQERV